MYQFQVSGHAAPLAYDGVTWRRHRYRTSASFSFDTLTCGPLVLFGPPRFMPHMDGDDEPWRDDIALLFDPFDDTTPRPYQGSSVIIPADTYEDWL